MQVRYQAALRPDELRIISERLATLVQKMHKLDTASQPRAPAHDGSGCDQHLIKPVNFDQIKPLANGRLCHSH